MPNILSVLKQEILRLARKEVRKEIEGVKKSTAQHRSEIAALKRRLATLEKPSRKTTRIVETNEGAEETKVRFSAKGLAKHRERLGLSASDYGKLLGVSAQTVYNWEAEKSRPRQVQLRTIALVRKLGKRQLKASLMTED